MDASSWMKTRFSEEMDKYAKYIEKGPMVDGVTLEVSQDEVATMVQKNLEDELFTLDEDAWNTYRNGGPESKVPAVEEDPASPTAQNPTTNTQPQQAQTQQAVPNMTPRQQRQQAALLKQQQGGNFFSNLFGGGTSVPPSNNVTQQQQQYFSGTNQPQVVPAKQAVASRLTPQQQQYFSGTNPQIVPTKQAVTNKVTPQQQQYFSGTNPPAATGYAAHNGVPAMNAAVTQMQNAKPVEVPLLSNNSSGINPIASAVSGWVNPFTTSAEDMGKTAGRSVGGTVDNVVDAASAYGGMVYDAAGNLMDSTTGAVSGFVEGFTGSRGPDGEPIAKVPAITREQQQYLSGSLPVEAVPTLPFTEHPSNMGDGDVPVENTVVPVVDPVTKTANSAIAVDKPITLPVPKEVVPVTDADAEIDALDLGIADTSKKASVNTKTFVTTDAEGKIIPVPPEQVKGIFDKASNLFGDIFSGADLKRMTLYTLGGLISGGSFEGSFKWAGMQVMKEQGDAKVAKATVDAKTTDFERGVTTAENLAETNTETKKVSSAEAVKVAKTLNNNSKASAKLLADATRAYREASLNQDTNIAVKKAVAVLALADTKAIAAIKAKTKEVKVPGINHAVPAYLFEGIYFDARTDMAIVDPRTGKPATGVQEWSTNDRPEAIRVKYKGIIESLLNGKEDEDGNKLTLGEDTDLIFTQFQSVVDHWEDQGMHADYGDPAIQLGFNEAVKASIESNASGGNSTPQSFFDMVLVKGTVSGMAGDPSIFKDTNGDSWDVKANNDMMGVVNRGVREGIAAGHGSNIASIAEQIYVGWTRLDTAERRAYNQGAKERRSGYIDYAQEIDFNFIQQ